MTKRGPADRLPVPAQDPGADRVERAGLDVAAGLADEGHDPLAQLARRPVRERDGEDLPRPHALDPDEVGHPMGQDARLATARAGQDQQRPLGRRDGACLLRVEPRHDPLGQRCRGGRGRGRVDGGLSRRVGLRQRRRTVGQELGLDGRLGRRPGRLDPDDLVDRRVEGEVVRGRLGTACSRLLGLTCPF